jgi:phosphate starvation-inducible PhoH-like protein
MQKRSAESKTKSTSSRPTAAKPKKTTVKELDLVGVQLKPSQQDYFQQIQKNEITFCSGPAGTSKTFTACFTSLHLLATKQVSKIILCKPIQESGEKLGFLPGDIADKIDPYMQSYISNFKKIVGDELTEGLISSGAIEFKPLAFMRGDTFDDAFMILDEAQNATFKQLMLFVTRMGKNSKVLVTGDVSQYDIPKASAGLPGFTALMKGVKGVGEHTFTNKDIVRAKILQDVVDRYDKWRVDNPEK